MDGSDAAISAAVNRRSFITLATAGLAVGGLASAPPAHASSAGGTDVLEWIDRHARRLRTTGASGPLDDLRLLYAVTRHAHVVGFGESAHGTHTQLTLKHRVARFLVEHLGFRTIAWEESWGSGVVIDRYVVGGDGDARGVVQQTHPLLRSEALLDLVRWMREFNHDRPDDDKVRFVGADVLELRRVQFDDIERYVTDVAPERLPELNDQLDEIKMRGEPQQHLGWYIRLGTDEKQVLIAHARRVYELVNSLRPGPSSVDRDDAVQHAHAILGFYEFYTEAGDENDLRDRYITQILTRWRRRTGHRVIYSAANAHTAANRRMLISFPDDEPGDDARMRELAGGRLRRYYGRRYVSIGTVFRHGRILTGWELQHEGGPFVYDVPAPHPSFIDHTLGQAREPNFLLNLRVGGPREVRRWLDGPAKMRIIGSAYYPENDADYSQTVDSWREGFDAILHIDRVEPTRLLDGY